MKTILNAAVLLSLIPLASRIAAAEGMTEARVIYQTTTNDKDGDTAVSAEIVCDSHTVAIDSGHNNQRWADQSSTDAFQMQVIEHPSKDVLNRCALRVSATARCNDRWDYNIAVVAFFDDGSRREWIFENGSLNSRDCHMVSQSFAMSNHR